MTAESIMDNTRARELRLTGSIGDQARSSFERCGWSVLGEQRQQLAPDLEAGGEDSQDVKEN